MKLFENNSTLLAFGTSNGSYHEIDMFVYCDIMTL
jgi:hypothetical protein